MRVYLIDSENVSGYIKELEYLDKDDKVIIFYSVQTPNISYSQVEYILKAKCRIKTIKGICGYKDDLDKQIISYLGFELRCNSKSEYYIVSKDKGYDVVVDFWNNEDRKVKRIDCIQESIGTDLCEEITSKTVISEEEYNRFKQVCKQCNANYTKVRSLILSTNSLSELHNVIVKQYKNEAGKLLYRTLKSNFSDMDSLKKAIR